MSEQIDFLKPRYETMGGTDDKSHYPGSPWEIGDILAVEKDGELYGINSGYVASVKKVFEKEAKTMPHLFRLMKWWEGLNPDEMPKYVRLTEDISDVKGVYARKDQIIKVYGINGSGNIICRSPIISFHPSISMPATETEYNEQHG